MRLRPSHLYEQDAADFAFRPGCPHRMSVNRCGCKVCQSGRPANRQGVAPSGGARSVLMRFFATGRAVLVTGLLAALPFWAQACAKNQPLEQAASVAAKEQPSTAKAPPPTARPMAPDPRVGAVFLGGGDLHTCTGGVLDSAAGDLILTAAHCVAQGVDATFVAGLHDTAP